MESAFHSFTNMGEFLCRWQPWKRKRTSFWHQSKRSRRRVSNFSHWHQLPGDVMESIVMHLNLSDRIRMKAVCKSWRALLLGMVDKNLMVDCPHDIPWLLFPRGEGPSARDERLFSFYSMSEGRFYHIELPQKLLALEKMGYCLYPFGSVRGWLAISNEPEVFLWNPLSGVVLQLPSLTTIPSYQDSDYLFIKKMDISNASTATEGRIVVAILCNARSEIALCTVGDTGWTVFREEGIEYTDILFSNKVLHALCVDETDESTHLTAPLVVETHTIALADNCSVMLKSFTHVFTADLPSNEILPGGIMIGKDLYSPFHLLESAKGELLMVNRQRDFFMEHKEENMNGFPDPHTLQYSQTKKFEIFRLDNHSLEIIQKSISLADQVLFCSSFSCLSLPTQNIGHPQFRKGNCIYFSLLPYDNSDTKYLTKVYREGGVFNLEDGTIKRFLPSFKLPLETAPLWFTPTLRSLPS